MNPVKAASNGFERKRQGKPRGMSRGYERDSERQGYRGCHYRRNLGALYRLLGDLPITGMGKGPVYAQLFDEHESCNSDVNAAMGRVFSRRVSIRQSGHCPLSVTSTGILTRSTKEHVRQANTQSMATSTLGGILRVALTSRIVPRFA